MNAFFSFSLACLFLFIGTVIPFVFYFRHKIVLKRNHQLFLKRKQKVELKTTLLVLTDSLESLPDEASVLLSSILDKLEKMEIHTEIQTHFIEELINRLQTYSASTLLESLHQIDHRVDSLFHSHSSITS